MDARRALQRAVPAAFFIVFGLIVARSGIVRSFRELPDYDSFMNACVAKNFVNGHGYRASTPESQLFDSRITSGPLIILPAAVAVRLVGNTLWAPQLVGLLLASLSLAAALAALGRFRASPAGPPIAAMTLSLAIILYTPEWIWRSIRGDPTAQCLAIAGAVGLFAARGPRGAAVSGLLLGLAAQTKVISWLVAAPALAAYARREMWATPSADGRRSVVAAIVAAAAPSAAWLAVQFMALGPGEWLSGSGTYVGFFLRSVGLGGGLSGAVERNDGGRLLVYGVETISRHFGGLVSAGVFLLSVTTAVAAEALTSVRSRRWATAAMFAGGLGIVVLWLALDPHKRIYRLFPAIIFLSAAAATAIESLAADNRPGLAAILLAAFLAPGLTSERTWLSVPVAGSEMKTALIETRDRMLELKAKHPTADFIGSGIFFNQDLEYVLPGSFNFVHSSEPRAILPAGPDFWVRGPFQRWDPVPAEQRACERTIIFDNRFYRISECPSR